ncbi:CoA ester lyase [Pseudomonas sp. LP_7_YM]|uniref:HpcH/HpaI aldolase/citrate lyase family protein n=1 Tax=Pseudomonas sp. LP_7_YM TaxID=2485137 RepID=UPI00105BDEEE|nr:CoA ester lyase [Pseudomonas sp. LP_7_YM]TDV67659.1 citrate lyase subunit beta/citryl-CoA lyase [Pseudomonas sp. LP_7_YM]
MRSKLFVPGSRPELFEKALASRADGVSFDLEDAVAESAKSTARRQLATFLSHLAATEKTLVVRVNGQDTAHYQADLEALVGSRLDIINLPVVESPEQIVQLVTDLERLERQHPAAAKVRILANIESPRGLRRAAEIACAHPRLMGLQLGFADLLEPLGINRHEASVIRQIQLAVRLAAGEANIAAYDAAFAAIKNVEAYREEARFARSLGFTGKSCIHPTQIDLANEAFLPGAEEIERAKRVLAAAKDADAAGVGAYTVDGQMVDAPFVQRARVIIEQARQAGLLPH